MQKISNLGQTAVSTFQQAQSFVSTSTGCRVGKPTPANVSIYGWFRYFGYPHPAAHTVKIPPMDMGIDMAKWWYMSEADRVALLARLWPHDPAPYIARLWPHDAPVVHPAEPPLPDAAMPAPIPVPIPAPRPVPVPEPVITPPEPPPPVVIPPGTAAPAVLPWQVGTYEAATHLIRRGCGGGFTIPGVKFTKYGYTTEERQAAGLPPLYIPPFQWEKVFGVVHEKAYQSQIAPTGIRGEHWRRLSHQQRRDLLEFPEQTRRFVLARWTHHAPPVPAAPPAPRPAAPVYVAPAPRPARVPSPPPPAVTVPVEVPAPVAPVPPQIQSIVQPGVEPSPPVAAQFVRPIQPVLTPRPAPYLPDVITAPAFAPAFAPPPLPLVIPEEIHLPPEEEGPSWVLYVLLAGVVYFALAEPD